MPFTGKKNILLIIPEMCVGGAQRSLANLSQELAKHYNIWVVVFNKAQLAQYALGGELLSLEVFSGNSMWTKISAFYKRVVTLKQLKKKLNIYASISFLEGADYVNILSKRKDKVIISIRGSKYHDHEISGALGFLRLRILMPVLYRLADKIVCVSDGIRAELEKGMWLRAEKLAVIYNFYDHNSLLALAQDDPEAREKYADLFQCDILLTVGRLHPQKNFSRLLDMFARVSMKRPDLKLVIVGDGPERENLVRKTRQLNLPAFTGDVPLSPETQKVFFTGYQKPGVFLKHSRLFLLPSLWEGFPNALMEALASGVPVAAADCPTGPREILAPETSQESLDTVEYAEYGVLLPLLKSDESMATWANCILEIMENSGPLDRYRSVGPQRLKHFSNTVICPQWIDLLEGKTV